MYGKDTISVIKLGAGTSGMFIGVNERLDRLDATTDEYAIIARITKDMTVDEVALNLLTVTGSPTFQVSIQTASVTSGDPDGTILGGASPASVQFAPTADGLQWITLDNGIALSKGDHIAIVIEDGTSGTDPDGSNYMELVASDLQFDTGPPPYFAVSTDTGSTWTQNNTDQPTYGLRNSGTTTDVQGNPAENWALTTLTGGVIGHIIAQQFLLPASMGRRVKIHGVHIGHHFANRNIKVGIWDSDSSATEIISADYDDDLGTGNAGSLGVWFAPTWVDTGHLYYVGVYHNESGGTTAVYQTDAITDDNLSAYAGYPNNAFAKYSGGSWTENAGLIAPGIQLMVSDWDAHGQEMQSLTGGMVR